MNIAGIAVSERGWVITGNRSFGAAAWHSTTGQMYTLVDHDPSLATSPSQYTWAGGVAATPTGWVIVGAVTPRATGNRDPGVWTSTDARTWTQVPVPGAPAFEDPQRVTVVGSTIVTVGVSDAGYGVWRGSATGGWSKVAQLSSNGGGKGSATSLVNTNGHLFTSISDQDVFSLWESDDQGGTWRSVTLPAPAPARADMSHLPRQ